MKRILSIFLFVIILSTFSGCSKDINSVNDLSSTSSEVSSKYTPLESLSEKLVKEIDNEYLFDSKLPEYTSNYGMCELAKKYEDKWKSVADEYYEKIMKYNDIIQPADYYYSFDDLHTFVSNMKSNWEEYSEKQCENHLRTLQTIYGSGTIVGPLYADYRYKMQKDWALEILGICVSLGIE